MASSTELILKKEIVGDVEYNISELIDVSLTAPDDSLIATTFNTPPTSPSEFVYENNQLIPCFVCGINLHTQIPPADEVREEVEQRKLLLTNFCFHMKLTHLKVPKVCSLQQSPLCSECLDLVDEFWRLEENLQQVHTKIENLVVETKRKLSGEESHITPENISIIENIEPEPSQILLSPIPRRRSLSGTFQVARLDPRTLNVIEIKQEIPFRHPSPIRAETPELNTSVLEYEPKKPRRFFEGVEYFKCIKPNKIGSYFTCSRCSHTVEIPVKTSKKDVTPNEQMKIHIQSEHTVVPKAPKRRREASFECSVCKDVFSSRKSLLDHKATHVSAQKGVRQPAKSITKSKTKTQAVSTKKGKKV